MVKKVLGRLILSYKIDDSRFGACVDSKFGVVWQV